MVAKTKAKTHEKLLSQLSGAEAANRKHKARIAELEKINAALIERNQELDAQIATLLKDAKK